MKNDDYKNTKNECISREQLITMEKHIIENDH